MAARAFAVMILILASSNPRAVGVPVEKPFGDFPKAVVFTGASAPQGATPVIVADGNSGVTDSKPGFILKPLGDGSWAVEAVVYPGASYQYYFEYRVPEFESDTMASFLTSEPGGSRNADVNRTRSIVIPSTAASGYVIYNAFGDASVWGGQATDTNLNISNPWLANWRPTARISPSTDGDTSGRDQTNNYNVTVTQLGNQKAKISWEYSMGGDGFVPHVEGYTRFGGTGAPLYGFQIYRADSNALLRLDQLSWSNVTSNMTGYPIFSDNDNDPWNASTIFTDTSVTGTVDSTYVYSVRFKNAYGMGSSDTSQFFSGGWKDVLWSKLAVEVDGSVDSMYGPYIATDPEDDQTNFSNLDLTKLWVTRDGSSHYFGLEVAADIGATNWGNYGVLVDVTGDSSGAPNLTHASLGGNTRKAGFPAKRPEYLLMVKPAGGKPVATGEIWRWTGTAWAWAAAIENLGYSTDGTMSRIEFCVPSSAIGSPSRIWVEGFSTGGTGGDALLDCVNLLAGQPGNDEWNAKDFSVKTIGALAVSTPFPPAILPPDAVTAVAFDSHGYITFQRPAQNHWLIDHFAVYFDSDLAKVQKGDSRVRIDTVPTSTMWVDSTRLVRGTRYYAKVYSVSSSGESAGSHLAMCDVPALGDTVMAMRQDEGGITSIEMSMAEWNAAKAGTPYAADEFFITRIMTFDEMYEQANFTDSQMWMWMDMVAEANRKSFFDPTTTIISDAIYPDTLSPVRQVVILRPDGTVAPETYLANVRVTFKIPYNTGNDHVTLEGPSILDERRLVVYKLNEKTHQWGKPNSERTQWVQYDSDMVSIVTSEFSIWTVLAGAGTINNFDQFVAYPNPFNAKDYLAAGHPSPPRITFAFMPLGTEKIEIFNVAGERVRTLNPNDASEFSNNGAAIIAMWDAKNDFGRDVASGVYIYWVRANGLVKMGKIAVIK